MSAVRRREHGPERSHHRCCLCHGERRVKNELVKILSRTHGCVKGNDARVRDEKARRAAVAERYGQAGCDWARLASKPLKLQSCPLNGTVLTSHGPEKVEPNNVPSENLRTHWRPGPRQVHILKT